MSENNTDVYRPLEKQNKTLFTTASQCSITPLILLQLLKCTVEIVLIVYSLKKKQFPLISSHTCLAKCAMFVMHFSLYLCLVSIMPFLNVWQPLHEWHFSIGIFPTIFVSHYLRNGPRQRYILKSIRNMLHLSECMLDQMNGNQITNLTI